ncbi:MAG TPA: DUF2382 domain-containing protein [Leptolyngbyaceae cyanobacterium]
MSEHQLVGSSVFDRTGHLIGKVSRVEPLAAGDFSLAVTPMGNQSGEIALTNHHLKSIDSQQKVIRTDLDYGQVSPNSGQEIQLVEERLVVNRKRNKVGEISIRKVIETEIVQVPIRREKLVIEKIGESEPLVEVGLSETRIEGSGVADLELDNRPESENSVVSGQFLTIREAVSLLSAIARLPHHGCRKFRIALFLRNLAGMETTLHEFESPDTAVRVLSGIETYLFQRCSSVYVDLFLTDPAMAQTYQGWFTEHATANVQ